MAPPILGYWGARAVGQPIRLLLEYTETEYEERRYTTGPDWFSIKFSLGLELPNLPYYMDDDVKLTQSATIMRYLGMKHGLSGNTAEDIAKADMLAEDLTEFRWDFIKTVYDPRFEELKLPHLERMKTKLPRYEAILKRGDWFLGNEISYVDFLAYEYLTAHKLYHSESFESHPRINDFLTRFEDMPRIRNYLNSDKCIDWPFHAPFAAWGGGPLKSLS